MGSAGTSGHTEYTEYKYAMKILLARRTRNFCLTFGSAIDLLTDMKQILRLCSANLLRRQLFDRVAGVGEMSAGDVGRL
jgi:hypothetical protein